MKTNYSPLLAAGGEPASITLLPDCGTEETEQARRFARSARHIALETDSLLCAAVYHHGGAVTCHGLPQWDRDNWSDFGDACWQFSPSTARHLLNLQVLGRRLGEALTRRWHPGAEPPHLGIVSDGLTVGLCPLDPEPTAPGWAKRLFLGNMSLTLFGEASGEQPLNCLLDKSNFTIH